MDGVARRTGGRLTVKALGTHGAALVALALLASFALYPFCGFVFGCGCVMSGFEGATHCNVHRPSGPHCPWCEHAWLGMTGMVLIFIGQAIVYFLVYRRSRSTAAAGFAGLLAFPLAATLGAFLTWLPTDYPHFLAFDARASWGLPDGPIRCVRPGQPLPRTAGQAPAAKAAESKAGTP
jgi:hypothetical protein